MGLWGKELLESFRADCLEKIDRLMSPLAEKSFRQWAEALTRPQHGGERVQYSRQSEQAERFTDMVLSFEAERGRRVDEYRRLIERIDEALSGAGGFRTGSEVLKWARGDEPLPQEGDIAP